MQEDYMTVGFPLSPILYNISMAKHEKGGMTTTRHKWDLLLRHVGDIFIKRNCALKDQEQFFSH